ncbi:hypothetical protein CDES_04845 [Corynebacterium deserti GIMN1.010]|uniref:Flavodoxin domain-containing protein n=1 Tax=Corynebacterium deserti GIMN1.010 TaxID=931089 RepID=A0A0M5IQY1_9CORY|nr:flavodoxin domain-containing protein [Corynebacterium deserti]ALC05411.1 hypothetical protein CDES_04845 [Corynebacterium deserti GIMN1.010]
MSGFIVAFESTYGSTKQYADDLATRLGTTAVDFEQARTDLQAQPGAILVVLSPVHGPSLPGAKFITDLSSSELDGHRVALCTVGMTLDDAVIKKDGAAKALGGKAKNVTRFYLPGRLNYSELSNTHRATMWTVVNMLKAKPMKNDNDKMMIDTFDTDVDRVDLSRLDEVEQWARNSTAG